MMAKKGKYSRQIFVQGAERVSVVQRVVVVHEAGGMFDLSLFD